jgi:hypothetical protein
MGFNHRKLEDQRREAAEKEAANRRATDGQVLEDAERLIGAWNERQAKRMPMLFSPTNRRRHHHWLLVSVGSLPGLPDHQRNRLAHARPSPGCGSHEPHSALSCRSMPTECAIRGAGAAPANEHRRRNAGRTSSSRAGRMIDRPRRREAAT